MADIAMLVAEEYERRVKNSRKIHGDTDSAAAAATNNEEIEFFPRVSVSAKRVDFQGSFGNFMMMMKMKDGGEVGKINLVKKVLEPRTEIGDAASKCFFSS